MSISNPAGSSMSIVAHLDDDLLFMNPDIQKSIDAGGGHTTVYLVAYDRGIGDDGFWQGRETGVKAAYAQMTGNDDWVDSITTFSNGQDSFDIQTSYLESQPDIRLYFLRINDGHPSGSGFANAGYQSLEKLWEGEIDSIGTADESNSFTREQITGLLLGIMEYHQPDTVMRQDHESIYNSSDHSDHRHTSLFVEQAEALYSGEHDTIAYVEYATSDLAPNLSPQEAAQTHATFAAYAEYDYTFGQVYDADGNPAGGSGWTSAHYHIEDVGLLAENPYHGTEIEVPAVDPYSFVSERGGAEEQGVLTFRMGGGFISNDNVQGRIALPADLADGDRFWVAVYDDIYTKAVQLEVGIGADGNVAFYTVAAKYDRGAVFSQLNGDFDAIQAHFNTRGNDGLVAGDVNAAGYGVHTVALNGSQISAGYLQAETPDILTFRMGGGYISNDNVAGSVTLPEDLADGDRFWVAVYDDIYTKAVQLEVGIGDDGNFAFYTVSAKYDRGAVYSQLNGDFDAIQAHFNTRGNDGLVAGDVNAAGYGVHSVALNGENIGAGYLTMEDDLQAMAQADLFMF